jgi:hypothetical protein
MIALSIDQTGENVMKQREDSTKSALEELRGSVLWYIDPLEPVGLEDWKIFDPNYAWDLPTNLTSCGGFPNC